MYLLKQNKQTNKHKYGSDSKETASNAGDLRSIPGLGRSPGGGHGNPLHGGIPMERGAWQAAVYGAAESDMTEQLSTLTNNLKTSLVS